MKITEVRVSLPKTELEHVVAFAGITIDGCFAIHSIRVIKSEKGLFVVMPSVKTTDGYRDICHPINKETREMINEAVIKAYEEALEKASDKKED